MASNSIKAFAVLLLLCSSSVWAFEAMEVEQHLIVNHPRRSYFLKKPNEMRRAKAYRIVLYPGAVKTMVQVGATGRSPLLESGQSVAALLQQANTLYHEERFQEAFDLVESAYQLEPDNPKVNTMLGSLAYQLGDTEVALKHWKTSLDLNPNQPDVKTLIEKVKKKEKAP
ncbi:MAG: tetratricopeptide repeat protein [Deltaproteobacteria bacterium]|nr:tetratricopeptide repeat protein [Deltaproteobacteria bacterium]